MIKKLPLRGTAISKSWKRVKVVKIVGWCEENGTLGVREVPLWLDPTGTPSFNIELPDYVRSALAAPRFVSRSSAEGIVDEVRLLMRRYHEWVKSARAEPVIILKAKYFGEDGDRKLNEDSFFIDSELGYDRATKTFAVGLQYWLAYRVNGNIHAMEYEWKEDPNNPEEEIRVPKVGWQKRGEAEGAVVLDYSEELHARIDAVCKAINNAVVNLHSILNSENVASALLGLKPGSPLLPKEVGAEPKKLKASK